MTSNSESICSQCRRAGQKLFLKGEKCLGPKCALVKRNFIPGQHGPTAKNKKSSGYGKQLREKQEAKKMYGLREKQFANYVAEASRKTGDTSKYLISYLESRLDNAIYRMGLVSSRPAARQLVSHGHITVNGKKVDISSYRVSSGEEIGLANSAKTSKLFENISEKLSKIEAPSWMHVDAKKVAAKILNQPILDTPPFNPKAIIEFYSR
ncbi:MAG: 30S ribosomal protein S4 [Candidatus Magasanikbacteria bacterium]|jgi:small subunit ribosomal protein S4